MRLSLPSIVWGGAASEHSHILKDDGQNSLAKYGSKPRIKSRLAARCKTILAAISRRQKQHLIKVNGCSWDSDFTLYEPAIVHDEPFGAAQYRDIDLGARRVEIYADTVVVMGDSDSTSVWGIESADSVAPTSVTDQDEDLQSQEIIENAIETWVDLQQMIDEPIRIRPVSIAQSTINCLTPAADFGEPDCPTTIIASITQCTTSSGVLRRQHTRSTLSSALHSRNHSDVSTTTVSSAASNEFSDDSHKDLRLSFTAWLKASGQDQMIPHEFWGCEDEDRPSTEENLRVMDYEAVDEACCFSESPRCLSLYEEPVDNDDHSHRHKSLDTPEAVTKSYVKFNDAFTRQIKEYSNLLDELADPDGTAEALRLVNSKLSVYLSNSSTSCGSFGLSSAPITIPTRKSETVSFSQKSTYVGDEEADAWIVGDNKAFCPTTPPFPDLAQFIEEGDFDWGVDSEDPVRPALSRLPAWNRGFDDSLEDRDAARWINM